MTAVQVSVATQGGLPMLLPAGGKGDSVRRSSAVALVDADTDDIDAMHGSATATYQPASPSAMILLGLDDQGRPHASRFAVEETEKVRIAADAMQFKVLPVTSEAMAELTAKLPTGKLFASGKAFVPFVKQELFDRLVAYLPIKARPVQRATKSAGSSKAGGKTTNSASSAEDGLAANAYAAVRDGAAFKPNVLPSGFDKIKVGSIVLASESRDDGWWTAVVTENKGDGLFLLQWEDWPDLDTFLRRPEQLALIHPAYKGE